MNQLNPQPTDQPRGNFVMNLNFRRNSNDKAPPITGRVSTPEDPAREYSFSAFQHRDDEGRPYWIGPVEMNTSMRRALNTTALQGEHFVAIRENGFKVFKELADGSPNPEYARLSATQQQTEDAKPSFWGSWTRTTNDPQLRLAAWDRDPSRYGPWASGNTQHPLTREEADALKAGNAAPAQLAQADPAADSKSRRKVTAERSR